MGCGKNGRYFCSSCIEKIDPLYPQIKFGVWPLNFLISIFPYKATIRKAIIKLKYGFASNLSDELIELAVRLIERKHFSFLNNLVLVPIPLYWRRKNWRGFNQTEILGRKLAERLSFNFCSDLLIRIRATQPQAKIKGKEAKKKRRKNVLGVFKINAKYQTSIINHQSFILFDDVWTTGSTIKECARILQSAGVKKVFGLTLAR